MKRQNGLKKPKLLFGAYRTIFRIAGMRVYILRIILGTRLYDNLTINLGNPHE